MKKTFWYLFLSLTTLHLDTTYGAYRQPIYSSEAPEFSNDSPTLYPSSDLKKISKFCQVDLKMTLKGSPSLPLQEIINSDFHRDILLLPYADMEKGLKPLLIQHSQEEMKRHLRNGLYKETRRPRPDPLSSFDRRHMRQSCSFDLKYDDDISVAQSFGVLRLDGKLGSNIPLLRAICMKDPPYIYRMEIDHLRLEHVGYILRAFMNENFKLQEIFSKVSTNANMYISQYGIQYVNDNLIPIPSPFRVCYGLEPVLADVLVSFLKNSSLPYERIIFPTSIKIQTGCCQERWISIQYLLHLSEICFRFNSTLALFNPRVL